MKRLSRNMTSLFAADILRRLLGFASIAYLARILDTSLFGAVNIGWTALAYMLALSTAGVATLGAKRIAAGEDASLIGVVIGSRLLVSALVFILMVCCSVLFIRDRITMGLVIIMGMSIFVQSFWVDWYYQGRESLTPVAIARSLSALVFLLVVLLFVREPKDVLWVGGAALMGDVIAADIMFRALRREGIRIHISLNIRAVIALLRTSLPLATGAILAMLTINYPPLALSVFRSAADVGLYGAASKMVFFLLLGDRILATLLLPASARIHARSPQETTSALTTTLRWVFVLGLPIAVGGTLLAAPLMTIVFGQSYLLSVQIFQVFIWYFFVTMIHTVYTSGLIAVGSERTYGWIMVGTAVLYVSFITTGAIWWGPVGAAMGVVVSELLSAVALRIALRRHLPLPFMERFLPVIIAVGGMGVSVFMLRDLPVIIPLAVGALAYGVLALATRAISWDDLRQLKERL